MTETEIKSVSLDDLGDNLIAEIMKTYRDGNFSDDDLEEPEEGGKNIGELTSLERAVFTLKDQKTKLCNSLDEQFRQKEKDFRFAIEGRNHLCSKCIPPELKAQRDELFSLAMKIECHHEDSECLQTMLWCLIRRRFIDDPTVEGIGLCKGFQIVNFKPKKENPLDLIRMVEIIESAHRSSRDLMELLKFGDRRKR